MLRECHHLKAFEVDGKDERLQNFTVLLKDAVERPWVPSKLRVLGLVIELGDLAVLQRAVFSTSYHDRPCTNDLVRRGHLEEFYMQIESLFNLTSLSLKVTPLMRG
ncbi:hypothetical protein BGX23_010061, partial [Mortierella sp. AD031]